ncbi:hypothetical protein [Saccharibacillus deserti]|uniref:hypothetical protein n=1 Tax=Saccharibacillus deserti TaxID=1634444 RepID=UPI001557D11C|nr:hypothetical protein [Saccharibacillus deserti]
MKRLKQKRLLSTILCGFLVLPAACGSAVESGSSSPVLPLDEIREEAAKKTPDWDTFNEYTHTDIGSGLYLWEYEVEGGRKLRMGGADLNAAPTQVQLIDAEGEVTDLLK